MIRINLIPYRAEFRQQQIIEYIIVFVAAVLLALSIVVIVNSAYTASLEGLRDEKSLLVAQNQQLRKKIGELKNLDTLRSEVESKLAIVDELQAGRFRSLTTLSNIAELMPQNIWLEAFGDKNGTITLVGFGESSKSIANLMRAIESSDWFTGVALQVDKEVEVEGSKARSFSLVFKRLSLAQKEANEKAAKEGKDES